MKRLNGRIMQLAMITASAFAGLMSCSSLGKGMVAGYEDPWHEKLEKAGITEKRASVGELQFNYAEGPDNGPALLLLNAQHMDWYSYSRVLPMLSEKFHLFAVDYPGHGKTTYPEEYPMTAERIGTDLASFIEIVIGDRVFVTGNSSGGLLTVWLAANRPELVRAIVLEDPPLFSAEYPRIKETVSYRSFTSCENYLADGGDDFLIYWLNASADFIAKHAGKNMLQSLISSIETYRNSNPGKGVEIFYLPLTMRMLVRGLDYYDPRFGSAFYDGSWNENFDHAAALKRIECPALLIHANFSIIEDGVLNGAMDQLEADKAVSLMRDSVYYRIDSDHVVNEEKPEQFVKIIEDFFFEE